MLLTRFAALVAASVLAAPLAAQCNATGSFTSNWSFTFADKHELACVARSFVIQNPHAYPIRLCQARFKMNRRWCTTPGQLDLTVREVDASGAPGSILKTTQLTVGTATGGIATAGFSSSPMVLAPGQKVHLVIHYDPANQCRPPFATGSGIQGPLASNGTRRETWCLTEPVSGRFVWVQQSDYVIYDVDYMPDVRAKYASYGQGCNGQAACSGSVLRTINWNPPLLGNFSRNQRYAIRVKDNFGYPSRQLCSIEIYTSTFAATTQVAPFAIYDEDNARPGQELTRGTLNVRRGQPAVHQVTFSSPARISAGTNYWVVFDTPAEGMILPIARFGNLITGAVMTPSGWQISQSSWMIRTFTARPVALPPSLDGTPPIIGQNFDIRLQYAPRGAVGQLVLGTTNPNLDLGIFGAPGCRLLASVDVLFPFRTNSSGIANIRFPITNDPSLVGAVFQTQAAIASNLTGMGLVFSNGREATIGSF